MNQPSPKACKVCTSEYIPKPMAYNSLYCSKRCRNTVRNRNAKYDPLARKRTYVRVKNDPELYELHKAHGVSTRRLAREWLSQYKLERGCIDCGYKEFACALQLDHEGPKSISIADARSSITRLKREIENGKCVVRCANCHSIKTWREKNGMVQKA